jgi:hypothetical protein
MGWPIGRWLDSAVWQAPWSIEPRLRVDCRSRLFDAQGVHGLDGGGAVCGDDGGDEGADAQGDCG